MDTCYHSHFTAYRYSYRYMDTCFLILPTSLWSWWGCWLFSICSSRREKRRLTSTCLPFLIVRPRCHRMSSCLAFGRSWLDRYEPISGCLSLIFSLIFSEFFVASCIYVCSHYKRSLVTKSL